MTFVNVETHGHVAHVTLSRPDKLNALGPAFWEEMAPRFAEIDRDPQIRSVVLLGEGRAFTAGLDLMAMVGSLPLEPGKGPDGARQAAFHQMIRDMQGAISCVERCRVPVIAAIAGPCIGGGIDLACACDIRLASQDAVFSVRETKMAIVADLGTLQRLPAIVGPGMARELVFTGRDFDAAEAHAMRFVNSVHESRDAVIEAAVSMAQAIAANPPLTVAGAKRVLNEATRAEIDRGLEYVATYNAAHLVSQDLGMAVAAFVSRETPEYSGR